MKEILHKVNRDRRWAIGAVAILTLVLAACFPHAAAHAAGLSALGLGGVGFAGSILDAQTLLSDAQAITATALSTNVFDQGLAGNQLSSGEPMCIQITVDVAAKLSAGNETYQFQIVQSANNDLSAADVLLETVTAFVTKAVLVKGYRLILPIPPALMNKRYLGLNYVTGGTGPTITVTAEIIPLKFAQNDLIYPKNFVITS